MKNLHDYDWPGQTALLFVVSWKMVDYQASKCHNISINVKFKAQSAIKSTEWSLCKKQAVAQTCSVKMVFWEMCWKEGVVRKMLLEISQKFTGKHLCRSLFFNVVEGLAQVLSCNFYEVSNNTFSCRSPPVAASETISSALCIEIIVALNVTFVSSIY